jgi:hypothetical protein
MYEQAYDVAGNQLMEFILIVTKMEYYRKRYRFHKPAADVFTVLIQV